MLNCIIGSKSIDMLLMTGFDEKVKDGHFFFLHTAVFLPGDVYKSLFRLSVYTRVGLVLT